MSPLGEVTVCPFGLHRKLGPKLPAPGVVTVQLRFPHTHNVANKRAPKILQSESGSYLVNLKCTYCLGTSQHPSLSPSASIPHDSLSGSLSLDNRGCN